MADKIYMNSGRDEDEDSDELSSEGEELLKAVKERIRDDDGNIEIMPFDESDSNSDIELNADEEDDDDLEQLMQNSDIEGADDEDDVDLPDTSAWGKRRSNYYNTDFVDKDYSSYNVEEEELAKDEEEEGKKSQLRIAQHTTEHDYQLDSDENVSDYEVDKIGTESEIKIKPDLRSLSATERMQILTKESPELLGLVQNFKKYINEIQALLVPVLNYVTERNEPLIPALQFAATYKNMLETYLTIVSFYFLAKVERSIKKHHPVFKRLLQLERYQSMLHPTYEEIIRPQLEALLERIQDKDEFQILNPIDMANENAHKSRAAENTIETPETALINDSSALQDEDGRRGINYQIAKNKGLVASKKKELRNPRVKHRGKYRKAIIRRKGAVRTVRNEVKRYGGEISGIKTTISKSIKFKN